MAQAAIRDHVSKKCCACDKPTWAIVKIDGKQNVQTLSYCEFHCDEHWKLIQPLVNLGFMGFSIRPPPKEWSLP